MNLAAVTVERVGASGTQAAGDTERSKVVENVGEPLPFMMRRVSAALSQQVDRALREFSLTHTQLCALGQLSLLDPGALSGATLGQRVGVTAQSMSTAVAGLLERGLVDRAPHPTHGRILQVRITPAGTALLARARAATKRVEDRALVFLDTDQRRQLHDVLRTMMRAMDLYLPDEDRD